MKMLDLTHTAVSRRAAAAVMAASVNEAAKQPTMDDSLLRAYLCLFQDTDIMVRKTTLANCHALLPLLADPRASAQIFSEVHAQASHNTHS